MLAENGIKINIIPLSIYYHNTSKTMWNTLIVCCYIKKNSVCIPMHFITTYKDNINEQCYYECLKEKKEKKKKKHTFNAYVRITFCCS
jgi:hypothetical protein